MEVSDCVKFAKRIVYRMGVRNPADADDISNEAGRRAHVTYDPVRGVPLRRWVAYVTKRDVWAMWRRNAKRKEVQKGEMWWEYQCTTEWKSSAGEKHGRVRYHFTPQRPSVEEGVISPEDWVLLYSRFVDKWPEDVIARRNNTTIYQVRKRLKAALSRLQ